MKRFVEKRNEAGKVIFRIDRRAKRGRYNLLADDSQRKILGTHIELLGFESLPSGFYRNDGYGLTTAGKLAVLEIQKRFGKEIALTVTAAPKGRIDSRGRKVVVVLSQPGLAKLGLSVRNIKQNRNEEMRIATQHFLGSNFQQFSEFKNSKAGYLPGRLAEILGTGSILDKLSPEDRLSLEDVIPEYLSKIPGTIKAKKKLRVIYDALDAGRKVYLSKVLKEFRKKLSANVQNEHFWQKFLSQYVLILRNSYGEVGFYPVFADGWVRAENI